MSNVADITTADFDQEVLQSPLPVLIDFWAPWCGPCRAMSPVIDQVAEEMSDKLKVVKMNTQDHSEKAADLGIMSIPCFIIFKGGEEIERLVGGRSYEDFKSFIEPHI